jgi:hypothetical protein
MEHKIEIVWTTHSINKNCTGNRLLLRTFMSNRRMFIEQEQKNLTTIKLLARIGENKIWERFHEQTRWNGDVVVGEWRKLLLSLVERGGGAWEWGREVGGCATTRLTHMHRKSSTQSPSLTSEALLCSEIVTVWAGRLTYPLPSATPLRSCEHAI